MKYKELNYNVIQLKITKWRNVDLNIINKKKQLLELFKTIILSIIIAFIITRFVRPIVIQGNSMVPTFFHGERYFVNKVAYINSSPKRNDIIVFKIPHEEIFLIKRVVAVEGDTISIKDNELYVNGEKVNEPYIKETMITPDIKEMQLHKDEVFVLGDNRNNSNDSRNFGPIKKGMILGKLITFSK